MTDIDWPTIRRQTIDLYGETPPHPEVEDEIVQAFEQYPSQVLAAISKVGVKVADGKVRSGWRVLRAECVDIANPKHNATATIGDKRELRIRQAEAYVRNAGVHYDRETEIVYSLFTAPDGELHDWRTDEMLVQRIVRLWRELRQPLDEMEASA